VVSRTVDTLLKIALGAAGVLLLSALKKPSPEPQSAVASPPAESPQKPFEGHYDVRRGAGGYASIVGTLGALTVPAITILVTVKVPPTAVHGELLVTFASSLLVVSMIASILSAFALAAIAGERVETPNLSPAIMCVGLSAIIGLTNMLASFEILSSLFLHEAKTMFALITGVGGLAGVFFVSLAIADSWMIAPKDPALREEWRGRQWLKDQKATDRAARRVIFVSSVPVIVGLGLRVFHLLINPTIIEVRCLTGVGALLAIAGVFAGVARTAHPEDGEHRGLDPWWAFTPPMAGGLYVLGTLILMP
jgi:hypothetical protein